MANAYKQKLLQDKLDKLAAEHVASTLSPYKDIATSRAGYDRRDAIHAEYVKLSGLQANQVTHLLRAAAYPGKKFWD